MAQETRITPAKINLAKSTNYKLNLNVLPLTQFWLTTCNLPTYSQNEVMIPDPVHGYRYKTATTSQICLRDIKNVKSLVQTEVCISSQTTKMFRM
jgi:hypothetical protein